MIAVALALLVGASMPVEGGDPQTRAFLLGEVLRERVDAMLAVNMQPNSATGVAASAACLLVGDADCTMVGGGSIRSATNQNLPLVAQGTGKIVLQTGSTGFGDFRTSAGVINGQWKVSTGELAFFAPSTGASGASTFKLGIAGNSVMLKGGAEGNIGANIIAFDVEENMLVTPASLFAVWGSGLQTGREEEGTCAAGGGVSTLSFAPTSTYVDLVNNDADGCVVTLTTSNVFGPAMINVRVKTNAGGVIKFAATNLVEQAGADGCMRDVGLGVGDTVQLYFNGTSYNQVGTCSYNATGRAQPFQGVTDTNANDITNITATFSTVASVTLPIGNFKCEARVLTAEATAADGAKVRLNTSGLTTTGLVSAIMYDSQADSIVDMKVSTVGGSVTLQTAVASANENISSFEATYNVTVGGTLTLESAEVAHTTGSLTSYAGSSLQCMRIPT